MDDLVKQLNDRKKKLMVELKGIEAAITAMTTTENGIKITRTYTAKFDNVCKQCKKNFKGKKRNVSYCSKDCMHKWNKQYYQDHYAKKNRKDKGVVLIPGAH